MAEAEALALSTVAATVTEPKPVAVTSSSYMPLSSENDTTPEALVVPDRKSGKRKAKSWLFLNTAKVAPGTLRVSVSWKRTAKKTIERRPTNHAITTVQTNTSSR